MNKAIYVAFMAIALTNYACTGKPDSTTIEVVGTNKVQPLIANMEAKALRVNTATSVITWKGTKMSGMGSHSGTVKMKYGELYIKGGQLTGGYFVADMNIIRVTDIPADDVVPIRNLTNHLKIDFDVRKFPTAKFEVTKVQYVTQEDLQVSGNLTIKDVTKNITVPVKATGKNTWYTAFRFNRFHWNIGKDGSWLEKRMVDEDVELTVLLKTEINY
ncbi:MAG TPA: YceI family protein [Flavisolibacter sp.]|nr:YceI family protein [Flavisolibacter sp.]